MNLRTRRQIGLDFYEFLQETNRTSVNDKSELRDIYNSEFRNRDGVRDPNFSSILYALKLSNNAKVYSGVVHFKPKVREFCQDQWQGPRGKGRGQKQQGASSSFPVQNGGQVNGVGQKNGVCVAPSPGPAQTSHTPRRDWRLANYILRKFNSDRAELISDRGGISITSDHVVVDGLIKFSLESETEVYVVRLFLKNSSSSPLSFTYYSALHRMTCFNLQDMHKVTRNNPLQLGPGDQYEVQLQFRSSLLGFYPATLVFEFKPSLSSSPAFHLLRFIEAQYVTGLARELAPTAPYRPRAIISATASLPYTVEDGEPPESLSANNLKPMVRLQDYKVPGYVRDLIKFLNGYYSSSTPLLDAQSVLESGLSRENYSKRFQLLLYLEELQMEVDIKRYNKPNTPMVRDKTNKKLLVLEVPGVSENRPSVLRGDSFLVTRSDDANKRDVVKYRGYVHRVELDSVKLGFNSKLLSSFVDGLRFDVEFTMNRLTTRLQQRATELADRHSLGNVLFPSGDQTIKLPKKQPLKLYDKALEQNPEQYTAVQNIVAGSSRPAPYLVFGPPGTGKTVTVVEAIKQVLKTQAHGHILACAPSNSAADLLALKLLQHLEHRKLFRMYAASRNPNDVPNEIRACCNLDQDCFVFPCKEELMKYSVMVTTLITAGRLVTGGVPLGHFSHVFVDEAGHAVETETIIPLAGLLQPETGQVVLAGDPKQLGPILRSPLALKHGMGVSLLERLMKGVSLYQKEEETGAFNNCYVTKLLRNYRSHPSILKVPNELFYEEELQVFANEMIRNSYCTWEHLPQNNFPVVFHGVAGRDEREDTSPSFFNVAEVEVLMDYLKKLLQGQGKRGLATISPKDIGIIAPYRKQVEKIRKALKTLEKDFKSTSIKDLKVGSVEEFQGQERRVILVSTVRSSAKYVQTDQHFSLGFVKNEKRFNVAVTRAKALLIVVGNPLVLRGDPTWGRFLQFCSQAGGKTGFDSSQAEGEEEVVERLAALCLQAEPQVETEESEVQQQIEPEWRNEQ
ncbi:putative helicase mov-10-B.1 isoform X1 [Coregonus clupeaformis]|uniref:putative helicase mov-10-B.1 isoform X1 n=1 Tax=Coregonus clupeaformis TaxID=59861 RepID=UPI001E1C75F6|nr:putative helicase mov-10-B.1 isoform X1 [Coregonus clupeaformis]